MSHTVPSTTTVSVIVTTYNRPEALAIVLASLSMQDVDGFEVLIADDGSSQATAELIAAWRSKVSFSLQHVWQEDKGFRAAKIRNKAVAQASSDYFIFLDGDCVVKKNFVRRHLQLAETNFFVAGNRVLFSKELTTEIIRKDLTPFEWGWFRWFLLRCKGACNRFLPLIDLPLGNLRKLQQHRWRGVKSCNLAVNKKDFFKVNGFDERYCGWGYEDSDLIIRLLRAGILHKSGRFALPVYHLWHLENDRVGELENFNRLSEIKTLQSIEAEQGVNQYLVHSL